MCACNPKRLHVCLRANERARSATSASVRVCVCVCRQASHSRDDQRGGEEQRPQQAPAAVGVLPLALVHLAAAVVAAAAQAEEEADHGHQGGEEQAHRRARQEADLVIDGLG